MAGLEPVGALREQWNMPARPAANAANEDPDIGLRFLPPVARLGMPNQDLTTTSGPARPAPLGVGARRFVLLGATGGLTVTAVAAMAVQLAPAGLGAVEIAFLVIGAALFGWTAFSFVSALAGAAILWRRPAIGEAQPVIFSRTALLAPTYNEDPGLVLAGVQAMWEDLSRLGVAPLFDIFVLSDTRDDSVATDEPAGVIRLRARLGAEARIFYRRRRLNTDRKAGNIADWVTRFGGAYEQMVILDADSLMTGDTLVRLVARMEAQPDAGLIQTLPFVLNATTLFGRLQQFAGRAYAPLIAAGQDWWSGSEGNYWGHNAILRTRAFASSAGLPHLPGKKPFGGHIMSHDFVEAALMRRAGWAVRFAADLSGSFEESPPTLVDMARRDRRWCQGNLQHAAVLNTAGLHWVSRLHLFRGILSYLTSPLWLVSLALAPLLWLTHAEEGAAVWPAAVLFAATMIMLLAPKLLAAVTISRRSRLRRAYGGPARLALGVVLESVFSALTAPVMMLMQSGAILDILMGRDGGWSAQQRDDASFTGGRAWWDHRWHIAIGFATAAGAWAIDPALFWLTAPVWLGLITSAPLSILTSSRALGRASLAAHLFVTPEETHLPTVVARARQLRSLYAWEAKTRETIAEMMSGGSATYRLGRQAHAPAIILGQDLPRLRDAKAA